MENKENIEQNKQSIKIIYDIKEKELLKIDLGKEFYLRLLEENDDIYLDFRKFFKGFPTKRGFKFEKEKYIEIKNILDKYIK